DELFGTTSIYDSSQIIAGADYIYVYDEDYSRLLKFGYDGSLAGSASMSGYYIIRITASGDYIYGTGSDYNESGIMIKINSSMTVESDHSYNCGPLFDMTPLSDGSFILCGTDTQGGLQSSSNMVLLRTDKNGDCDEKSGTVKEDGEKLSVRFDRLK
nr:hypothetical protein [Clostridiales bacterium]